MVNLYCYCGYGMDNIRFNIKLLVDEDIKKNALQNSLVPKHLLISQIYLVMYYFSYQQPIIISPLKTFRISKDQLALELQLALSKRENNLEQKYIVSAVSEGLEYILASPISYYIVA